MKRISIAFTVAAFALLAALCVACSSRGTSPIPAAAASPSFPVNGAAYSVAGESWGIVRPAGTAAPQPIPTMAMLVKDVVVTTGASFEGRGNLIDSHYVERAPGGALSGDDYAAWVVSGSGGRRQLEAIAEVQQAKNTPGTPFFTSAEHTIYAQPPIDVRFPFAAGSRWDGSSAYRTVISGSSTFQNRRVKFHDDETWNADGSYARSSLNYPFDLIGHTVRFNVAVAGDGSSKSTSITDGGTPYVETIGVPQIGAGGKYGIHLSLTPGVFDATIPDWYPGGALPPSPLVSATVVDRGPTALPSSCRVPHSIATSGEAIARTQLRLDPNGIVEEIKEVAYYASGIGAVCVVSASNASLYAVFPPRARLEARLTLHLTTYVTQFSTQTPFVRSGSDAGVFDAAGAMLLHDLARRREAAILDLLRRFSKTR